MTARARSATRPTSVPPTDATRIFSRISDTGAGAKPSNSRIDSKGSNRSRNTMTPATTASARGAMVTASGSAMISWTTPSSRANSWPATSKLTKVSRSAPGSAAFAAVTATSCIWMVRTGATGKRFREKRLDVQDLRGALTVA